MLQNIQDVCHNCSKLKSARDELELTTVYESHEDDQREQNHDDNVNTVSFEQISELFQQADDFGIREIHPSKRKLNIIATRHDIVEQKLPQSRIVNADITDIPKGLMVTDKGVRKGQMTSNDVNKKSDGDGMVSSSYVLDCKMVIEIINDNVINGMPLSEESNDVIQKDPLKKVCIISLQNIILQYTLDFKQSVAFEVMASSFILNLLQKYNLTQESIEAYFKEDETQKHECIKSISRLKKIMDKKGGVEDLAMFLSGMGGTGKSEVIKAFVFFVENICNFFNGTMIQIQ